MNACWVFILLPFLFFAVYGKGVYNKIEVDLGSSVLLKCQADENLNSKVKWIRSTNPPLTITDDVEGYFTTHDGQYLRIQSLSFNDEGIFTCYSNGTVVRMFDLKIHYQSTFSGTLDCVTSYTFSKMNCCWRARSCGTNCQHVLQYQLKSEESDEINFVNHLLYSKIGSCNGQFNKESNEKLSTLCCDVPLNITDVNNAFITYTVDVKTTLDNNIFSATSNSVTEYPLSWVKPCPPGNVSLNMIHTENRYFVEVDWESPKMDSLDFFYRVRYRIVDEEIEDEWKTIDPIFFTEYVIDHVRHNSVVEVQVGATPHDLVGGFWSDWTPSSVIATGQLAPIYPMQITNATFTKFLNEEDSLFTIRWKPYIDHSDVDFYNVLQYCDCTNICKKENVSANAIKHSIKVCNGLVRVSGLYCNSKGCSPESEAIIAHGRVGLQFVSIANFTLHGNGSYTVAWNNRKQKNNFTCKVQIFAISRLYELIHLPEVTDFHRKARIISETNLPCFVGQISAKINYSHCMQYTAAVSVVKTLNVVEYENMNSLSDWLDAKESDHLEPIIQQFNDYNVTSTSATIKLHSGDNISKNLFLAYRPLADDTPYTPWMISKIESMESQLVGLDSYTNYESTIVDCCEETPMVIDGISCCRTTDSPNIYFTTEIGEPSKIVHFIWDWNNGVLQWEKPEPANGPIGGYIISFFHSDEHVYNLTSDTLSFSFLFYCGRFGSGNISISAFNFDQDKVLVGDENVLWLECDNLTQSMHVVVALVLTGCIVVIIACLFLWCYRRKVKHTMIKLIWPPVPAPKVVLPKPDAGWRVSDAPTTNGEQNQELVNLLNNAGCEIVDEMTSIIESPAVPERDETKEYISTYHSDNKSRSKVLLYTVSKQNNKVPKVWSPTGSIPSYLLCDSGIYTSFANSTLSSLTQDKEKYNKMLASITEDESKKDIPPFDFSMMNSTSIEGEENLLHGKPSLLNDSEIDHSELLLAPHKRSMSMYSVVSGTSYVKGFLPSHSGQVSQDYVLNGDYFIENSMKTQ